MRRSLRLAVVGATAIAAVTASAAVAAGLAQGLTPGHQTRLQQFAAGGIGDPASNFVQVSLDTGTLSFRTRGGATITEDASTVTVSAFTSDGLFGFGCWLVPASMIDFNIQTVVSLRFDSTAPGIAECPGLPMGAAISAAPAMTLDDTSIQGFVGRVALDATWTAAGPLDSRISTTNTTCGGFSALDTQDERHYSSGPTMKVSAMTVEGTNPATGDLEDLDLSGFVSSSSMGDVSEVTENIVVNGPSTGSCGQLGA
jgi:hypothetical protein